MNESTRQGGLVPRQEERMHGKSRRGARRVAARGGSAGRWRPGKRAARGRGEGERARWLRQTWGKAVEKGAERRPEFATTSGIRLQPVYAPEDVKPGLPGRLGLPGEYPFTRGVQPTMYRGRFWTMRQYAGFGTAEESPRNALR